MHFTKIFSTVLILAMGFVQGMAQNPNFGLTGSIGASTIASNRPSSFEQQISLSGNAGILAEMPLGKTLTMGIGALWVPMTSEEIAKDVNLTTEAEPFVTGSLTTTNLVHINYLGLPIYFRLGFGKLGINFGFQTLGFINAQGSTQRQGVRNGVTVDSKSTFDDLNFDSYDYGPIAGLDFAVHPNIRVRADAYYGLTDIGLDSNPIEYRNRQVTLGISYFFPKGREKKKDKIELLDTEELELLKDVEEKKEEEIKEEEKIE